MALLSSYRPHIWLVKRLVACAAKTAKTFCRGLEAQLPMTSNFLEEERISLPITKAIVMSWLWLAAAAVMAVVWWYFRVCGRQDQTFSNACGLEGTTKIGFTKGELFLKGNFLKKIYRWETYWKSSIVDEVSSYGIQIFYLRIIKDRILVFRIRCL